MRNPLSTAEPERNDNAAEPPWHALAVPKVAERLASSAERGLTAAEIAIRRQRHGANTLTETRGRSRLAILFDQFESLIVLLLLVAAVVAFVLGENVEGVAILVVIVLNAAVGFFTEWKAHQALAALRKQAVPTAHVIRDGDTAEIPSAELVPGDLVVLTAGSRVPADGRLVEAVRLQIEEASLTGESHAAEKMAEPVADPEAPLGDRLSMAYLGTTVTAGRGLMLVTATGARTQVGLIGKMIEEAEAQDTPLERKLEQLGHALIAVVLVLCAVIVLAGWLRGNRFLYMLEVGISLAIAAVPEGLPAVATMTLALGMQRMARMRALVRQLPAVETLGSTTVICSDKTGTLTRNEMTVRTFVLGERRIGVTGTGYAPVGEFREAERAVQPSADEHLLLALKIGLLCNDSTVERNGEGDHVLGDPTEAALVVAAQKAGLDIDEVRRGHRRIGEVPFDSAAKRMITVHVAPDGKHLACVKGATAAILRCCVAQVGPSGMMPLREEDRQRWDQRNNELAAAALRVLALAYRELPDNHGEEDLGRDLVFVGLVGMIDPLRQEARQAIAVCRDAGIRVVMITGDQQATAAEIARQLGIDRDSRGRPLRVVHARDLAGLDAQGWQRVSAEAAVFARVSPEHKLRIVEALQRGGEVVAMTGDGVNDAPALKKADIGVAMGIKGTEVAKEAADMVVTDDNFATIVAAVEQGRVIYSNILRFIHYLFSCNLSEILVVFIAILLGWPLPLAPLQVLWLNMITDVFPALALALEPSSPDAMKRPPRNPGEPLLSRAFVGLIAWQGALLTVVTLLAFWIGMRWHGTQGQGLTRAVTLSFMTLALAQVFHAFSARSQVRSAFTARLFSNGWLWAAVLICVLLQLAAIYWPLPRSVLHTAPLDLTDWALVLGCSLAPVVVVELVKLAGRIAGPGPKGGEVVLLAKE